MKTIYSVCSWGLGHATRSLPVIRKLIDEGHEVTIVSTGGALDLLKDEIGGKADYFDLPDYPMLLSKNAKQFMAKTMVYWPVFIRRMQSGLSHITKMVKQHNYDLIISDGRYDSYSKKIPSFFMSHQMRIKNPLRISCLETGSEIYNLFFFKRFCGVLIPDYRRDDLSGELSHRLRLLDEKKLHYVGALSDFSKKTIKKDIDYFISLSGPEPQRTMLEKKMLSQAKELNGRIVITLGKKKREIDCNEDGIEVYSIVSKEKREELLNRAKMIISRSGYSTIMDLAAIGSKALMTPTPGQVEQEYLAQYHNEKNTFYSVSQDEIDLKCDIEKVADTTGVTRQCDVRQSVENIIDVISNCSQSPF